MSKLISYRPLTPARRHAGVIRLPKPIEKTPRALTIGKRTQAGRNNTGKITVRHQGSGVKQRIRIVDMKREKFGITARVSDIHYDPNRTAHIALLSYRDGEKRYILAPMGLQIGATIVSDTSAVPIEVGNRMPLAFIPAGQSVHCIELSPGKGGKIIRSAGSAATLMNVEGDWAQLKMPSGEVRLFPKDCMATVGQVGNADHRNVRLGKAGRMRKLGVRPRVRGKAMNPVDHPHGGGEGLQPIGMKSPKNVFGKKAYGVKTRRAGRLSDRLILKRRVRKHA